MFYTTRRFIPALVVTLMFPAIALSQLTVQIDSVDMTGFPTVRLMTVTKEFGLLQKTLAPSNFVVRENGFTQGPVSYFGTRGNRSFSMIILLAAGSYVSQNDFISEKGIASKIIDSLDGLSDEATILTYNDQVGYPQPWTPVKQLLQNALSGISGGTGGNRFWDGVYAGVNEALGTSNYRALLVISNGRDDGSTNIPSSVISRAKTFNLPVFTVGVNSSGGEANLQTLAEQTGGTYFTNSQVAIETIVNFMRQTPPYCILEYQSNNRCRDGAARTLDIQVSHNSRTAGATGQYPLSQDPASNVSARFKVDTASIASGGAGTLGVLLQDTVKHQLLYPGTFTLEFDTTKLRLTGVAVDTALAKNTTVGVPVPTANGAVVTTSGTSQLNGKGRFLTLNFTTTDVTQNTDVSVNLGSVSFTGGCILPQPMAGRVRILPKNYGISGKSLQIVTFTWNDAKKDYDPAPAEVAVEIQNTGDLPLTDVSALFPTDSGYRFVLGSGAVAAAVPATLQPGQKATARWFIKALPHAADQAYQCDVIASAKENVSKSIRVFMTVRAATSGLAMNCSADSVRIVGGAHTPNPATVRAYVRSAGTAQSPSGQVTLEMPPGINIASGSSSQTVSAMAPGGGQWFTWQITYPTSLSATEDYDLAILLAPAGAPADTCILRFSVPPLTGPNIVASCLSVPGFVAYDTVSKSYPDVIISGRIHNIGTAASDTVTAVISLPPELVFRTGQTALKVVSPSMAPNDSADVTWTLGVASVACIDRLASVTATLRHQNADVLTCAKDITVFGRPNLLPEIQSFAPPVRDTLPQYQVSVFRVLAVDVNGDPISYTWWEDGHQINLGINADSSSIQFGQLGPHVIRCVIRDGCGQDSVVIEWDLTVVEPVHAADLPAAASDFGIRGIHPNPLPARDVAMVEFAMPAGLHAFTLDLIDGTGATVARVAEGTVSGGMHVRAIFLGRLAPGAYFLRLAAGNRVSHKSLVVLK